jgi:hypothetical protein
MVLSSIQPRVPFQALSGSDHGRPLRTSENKKPANDCGALSGNEELTAHLPEFFRTLSGQKPSREDMEKLLKIIQGTRKP